MKNSKKNKILRFFRKPCIFIPLLIIVLLPLLLILWTFNCERRDHGDPAVPRVELSEILTSKSLSSTDYETLYQQTGLGRPAIDALTAAGLEEAIYTAQQYNFTPPVIRCTPNTFITREERVVDENGNLAIGMPIPYVEDGDILITYCSHFFGWRNGHAAIVVDAGNRLTLEAQVLGQPSCISSLDKWEKYPTFLVLRLSGADLRMRSEIAEYAKENLNQVPYRLIAGIFPDKTPNALEEMTTPSSTHCSHLVWYAFSQFGFDLDSDGGLIVTPDDIANSPLLEIVQSYGLKN